VALHLLESIDALDDSCEKLLAKLGLGKIDFDIQSSLRFLVEARVLIAPDDAKNGEWEFAKE
jgi:hypothetical protein